MASTTGDASTFTWTGIDFERAFANPTANQWYPADANAALDWPDDYVGEPVLGGGVQGSLNNVDSWDCTLTYQYDGNPSPIIMQDPGYYLIVKRVYTVTYEPIQPPPWTPPAPTPCPPGTVEAANAPRADIFKALGPSVPVSDVCETDTKSTAFTVVSVPGQCNGPSDFSNPADPYINQYEAGASLGLPLASDGKQGGQSCGVSSFTMAVNGFKRAANLDDFINPLWAFRNTMTDSPLNGALPQVDKASFDWNNGWSYADGLGFTAYENIPGGEGITDGHITHMDPVTFLNSMLAAGADVLISTQFCGSAWSSRTCGHVVLVTGTVDCAPCVSPPDYLVDDPAGSYTGSPTQHYGAGLCGYQVVYPSDFIQAAIDYPGAGRPALAIFPTAGADPASLSVTNESSGPAPQFWLQDSSGRRTGWTGSADGQADLPNSFIDRDPIISSDPNAPDNPYDPNAGPEAILLGAPGPDVTLHVSSSSGGPFQLDLTTYDGAGTAQNKVIAGTLLPGQVQAFDLNGASVTSSGSSTTSGEGNAGNPNSNGGHSAPCSGLNGASRARCRAKLAYTTGLATCNRKYHGHSRSTKAKDAACRKRVTATYHRTLAEIGCSQLKNKHKRAMCAARARRVA